MALVSTDAVLLRSHPYSDSSRILRFYTRDRGLVGVMARGVRSRGARGSGGLELLRSGRLTVYLKEGRDLQTFKEFSPDQALPGLGTDPTLLAGGSLLAELVLRHAGSDENPELYGALVDSLASLPDGVAVEPTNAILARAWYLVAALGYMPEVDSCVQCGRELEEVTDGDGEAGVLRFDFSSGGFRCPDCSEGLQGPRMLPESRARLRDFLQGAMSAEPLARPAAHLALLDDFVTYHVSGGHPLKSMSVLRAILES
jgi:DNA repair protein RecO (recombination protein O)